VANLMRKNVMHVSASNPIADDS